MSEVIDIIKRRRGRPKYINVDTDWLETFICDYFNRPRAVIRSCSLFLRDRKVRYIYFCVLIRLRHKIQDICSEYRLSFESLKTIRSSSKIWATEIEAIMMHLGEERIRKCA